MQFTSTSMTDCNVAAYMGKIKYQATRLCSQSLPASLKSYKKRHEYTDETYKATQVQLGRPTKRHTSSSNFIHI